jgi:endoglucanase
MSSRRPTLRIVSLLVLLLLVGVFAGAGYARYTRDRGSTVSPHLFPGYWHTDGTRILDSAGATVRVAGVTWYGMESAYWVPAGLDYQRYTTIMDEVKSMGFNTIRLPYSNQLVEQNPVVTRMVNANPQFLGAHAMDVMDAIVAYAGKIGLKIILDDHRCIASTPKRVNFLDEPLWYTTGYPESSWIHDWETLARRYKGDSTVIGFDLRNEPHTDGPGPWDLHAYLHQGATWGPYRGVDNPATDWRLAAERAGNGVLAIDPHLLMFVEGLQIVPDPARPSGVNTYWWGSDLSRAVEYPVQFDVPHQLVYSPHDWGPWKWNMPWLRHATYESIQAEWHTRWSMVLDGPNAAPVWIGEFGTCTNNRKCVDVQRTGNQAAWFHLLLRYLHDNPNVGWSFFALNGSNSNDHAAKNGLLNADWSAPANPALIRDLQSVQGT